MKEYELKDGPPQYGRERQPTNSALVTEFRRVSQMVQNTNAAEKSRKTSRLSKGLNPDVPRSVAQPTSTHQNM